MIIKRLFQKRQEAMVAKVADWTGLAIGVAVFATVALWNITKSSFWFDEAFSAYIIRFDFFEIARYTANDVHPPLYYWLLKLWSLMFGTNELALRSMSVFFAGVAIIFGFLLVKRLFGRKAAWVSLAFMVVAPLLIRYGEEARMYTMVTAISLAATYVLTIAMESKKKLPWILYGILVSLGMWTHYFTAIVWIAHWVWRALLIRQTKRKSEKFLKAYFTKAWIYTHVLAVGLFLPWLPLLAYQVVNVQVNGFWIPPVSPSTFTDFFTNVLFYQDQDMVSPWMTFAFFLIVLAIIVLAVRSYRANSDKWRQNYLLIGALAFVPGLLLFVFSMPPLQSSFVDRYLVPSALALSLFMGVTIAAGTRFMKPIQSVGLVALVLASCMFGVTSVYELGNYNKTLHTSNNTREMIQAISARAPVGEPIIADSPWLFYEAAMYSTPAHPVYFIDADVDYRYGSLDMLQYNDEHKIKDLDAFSKEHDTIWYMGRPADGSLGRPRDTWKSLQQLDVYDSVSGLPAYKAIRYETR